MNYTPIISFFFFFLEIEWNWSVFVSGGATQTKFSLMLKFLFIIIRIIIIKLLYARFGLPTLSSRFTSLSFIQWNCNINFEFQRYFLNYSTGFCSFYISGFPLSQHTSADYYLACFSSVSVRFVLSLSLSLFLLPFSSFFYNNIKILIIPFLCFFDFDCSITNLY